MKTKKVCSRKKKITLKSIRSNEAEKNVTKNVSVSVLLRVSTFPSIYNGSMDKDRRKDQKIKMMKIIESYVFRQLK
jgi:hypothetical protein